MNADLARRIAAESEYVGSPAVLKAMRRIASVAAMEQHCEVIFCDDLDMEPGTFREQAEAIATELRGRGFDAAVSSESGIAAISVMWWPQENPDQH